jgi:hypothetical protein
MQDVETVGLLLLKGVIIPALGVVTLYLAARVPGWIAAKVGNQRIAGILDRIAQLAFTVVQEIQQTVITKLRESEDADEPTRDQLSAARDQAITTLKSHLGPKGLLEIKQALQLTDDTAVEKLITSFIESAVLMLKQQEPKSE